ncbi:acyl carrier protein [Streptomyces sp. NPDC054766]|uniref:acyl carrier protein n=1 Tax=Streptomyces rhizosphaerihabitans TaxID=1266770 RepID=UPI0021C228A0|nr:acyl carrier protein [Streptomyces rhizosphaerihabitans]MCT9008491.1 acyl carrier protein [Streptomyces rhizosphaerihabitans]
MSDDEICRLIASVISKAAAKKGVTPEKSLRGDLGIDSLGLMSIVFVLEEKAGIDAFSQVERFVGAEFVSDIIKIVRQS